MTSDEFKIPDDSIDVYMGHLREIMKKSQRMEYGPGGIMEMKQTIADREAEIERLKARLSEIEKIIRGEDNGR